MLFRSLYAVAELAQHLIKARAKSHSWPLESYPGKVRIPGDIFRPLPNVEAANEVRTNISLSSFLLNKSCKDFEDCVSSRGRSIVVSGETISFYYG